MTDERRGWRSAPTERGNSRESEDASGRERERRKQGRARQQLGRSLAEPRREGSK